MVVKDLSYVNFSNTDAADPFSPTAEMSNLAEKARMIGTTLWFDETNHMDNMKKAIVVTAQFTICYNLLKFIGKLEKTAVNE